MKISTASVASLAWLLGWAGCSKAPSTPPAATAASAVPLVAAAETSARFEAVNRHLELGGTLYGYVDLNGDAEKVASWIEQFAAQLQLPNSTRPPVTPEQLVPILRALRLEDLKAAGLSSVREPNGEFRNHAFLSTPEGRHGVMAVFGGAPGAPHHLRLAPKDADVYEELGFDVPALAAAIKQAIVGSQGEAAFDQVRRQAETTGAAAGVSSLGIVHALKGRMTLLLRSDPTKTITIPGAPPTVIPRFALLIGLDGLGTALQPLLDRSPVLSRKEDNGRPYYTPKIPLMIDGVRPVFVVDGADLYFGSDEFFTHECFNRPEGEGLATDWDYQRLIRELGPEVNTLIYVAPRLFTTLRLMKDVPGAPKTGPFRAVANVMSQMQVPPRPLMAVSQNLPDGILFRSRMDRSLKSQMIAGIVYNPLTLALLYQVGAGQAKLKAGDATAPPTANRRPAPTLTPDERVVRNLRLLKILADSYYRRTGSDTVQVDELVGPGRLIPQLLPVEGENYRAVHLKKGEPIEVTLPDGRTLRYSPPPSAPVQP
jgi:hypothetical protein